MRLRRYRVPAILMLALLLGGCYKWVRIPTGVPPGPVIEREDPPEARLALIDGTFARIHDPQVAADSIYDPADQARGYALQDVVWIDLRIPQASGVILVGSGLLVLGAAVYYVFWIWEYELALQRSGEPVRR